MGSMHISEPADGGMQSIGFSDQLLRGEKGREEERSYWTHRPANLVYLGVREMGTSDSKLAFHQVFILL